MILNLSRPDPGRKKKINLNLNFYFCFPVVCAAVIAYRNHLRALQQNKSGSKVKFRQASNRCKSLLSNLLMLKKTKRSITNQKIGSRDFWQVANSVLNKGKSAIPPLFNELEVMLTNLTNLTNFFWSSNTVCKKLF